METKGILLSAALLSAVTITPFVAHSVTLGNAQKTPCLFGALGTRTQCETPQSIEKMRLGVTPKNSRSTASATGESVVSNTGGPASTGESQVFTEGTAPSESIQHKETEEVETESPTEGEEVATVPLPFGGALLLTSIGLMILANRKRS